MGCSLTSAQKFSDLANCGVSLANSIVVLLVGVALVVFFWGLVKFLASAGGTQSKIDGRRLVLWGLIALFIMLSIGGVLNLLKATFFQS